MGFYFSSSFYPAVFALLLFFFFLIFYGRCDMLNRRAEFFISHFMWILFCVLCIRAHASHSMLHNYLPGSFFSSRFVRCSYYTFFLSCGQSTTHILCISHFRDVILLLFARFISVLFFFRVSPPLVSPPVNLESANIFLLFLLLRTLTKRQIWL